MLSVDKCLLWLRCECPPKGSRVEVLDFTDGGSGKRRCCIRQKGSDFINCLEVGAWLEEAGAWEHAFEGDLVFFTLPHASAVRICLNRGLQAMAQGGHGL